MTTPLHGRPRALRLAAIGLGLTALAAGFAYTAGWIGNERLTPKRIIDTFEAQAGHHPGYRKNHAKGLCVSGYFQSSGEAAGLSSARVFSQARVPVIGRFAIGGANPHSPDASVPTRSLALQLSSDDGQQWRTGMNTPPVLAVGTPEAFYQQVLAMTPDPATGKPDPSRLQAFFAAHPESAAFRQWAKDYKASDSFANSSYNSINAFALIDAEGKARYVRWSLLPQTPFAALPTQVEDNDYLQHDLRQRLSLGPLRWTLQLTLAAAGDAVNDPSQPWPGQRPTVDAGTLVIDQVDAAQQGACRDLNFDPLILPTGIKPSADPILAARSAAYSESFNRRSREAAQLGARP
ncbi:catalase family peroxidase [Pseudomonas rubra]|uniref:Catalase-related peroxidase n=1 Tax=Pseudomonas rubra TaxID=2942627 RepID=A0ABT5PAN6_9PSED|nr:catalase family peroxidase [Pseudomonas rubra]MDD1015093.1 catalase family peroxidase [Pseudomonas rubra]MDD1038572.1 catalase family peroxidase [Pseudomonas rubra]MDD1154736.1 catalase family peroxidase [Pseudomonas rubra]